jgi:preprotein translocase subunit SecA
MDYDDKVYFNQTAKWKAVVETIAHTHRMGQPILIGTSSIHTSEKVSNLLKNQSIRHQVLNAKFHEQEAQIVSNAGQQ